MPDPERSEYLKGRNEGYSYGFNDGEEWGYSNAWKDIRRAFLGAVVLVLVFAAYFFWKSPSKKKYPPDLLVKACGSFDEGGILEFSVNVATVTVHGNGEYHVRFLWPFSSTSYACTTNLAGNVEGGVVVETGNARWSNDTAIFRSTGIGRTDANYAVQFACFGDQL